MSVQIKKPKLSLLTLIVVICQIYICHSAALDTKQRVQKRSLVQFGEMVIGAGLSMTDYPGYGNWCGKGGGGGCADLTDQCCFIHDNCYGYVQDVMQCGDVHGLLFPYSFKVVNKEPFQVKCNAFTEDQNLSKLPEDAKKYLEEASDFVGGYIRNVLDYFKNVEAVNHVLKPYYQHNYENCSLAYCLCDATITRCFQDNKATYDKRNHAGMEWWKPWYQVSPTINYKLNNRCNVTVDNTPLLVETGEKRIDKAAYCNYLSNIAQIDVEMQAKFNC